jgi:hypothetical protein
MYFLPCHAKFSDVVQQLYLNVAQLAVSKTEIHAQAQRASRTIQVENGAVPLPDNVNVRRPMIVWVDNDSRAPQSQDGRHERSVP